MKILTNNPETLKLSYDLVPERIGIVLRAERNVELVAASEMASRGMSLGNLPVRDVVEDNEAVVERARRIVEAADAAKIVTDKAKIETTANLVTTPPELIVAAVPPVIAQSSVPIPNIADQTSDDKLDLVFIRNQVNTIFEQPQEEAFDF